MTIKLNGGYLEMDARLVSSLPCTFLAFTSSAANAAQMWVAQQQSNAQRAIALWLDANGSSKYAYVQNPGSSATASKNGTPDPVSSALQMAAAVFASPTSRTAYYGSSVGATNTDNQADNLATHDRFTVGCWHYNGAGPALTMHGEVAETHAYNRAVTPAELDEVRAGTKRPEEIAGHVTGWTFKDFRPSGEYLSMDGLYTLTAHGDVTAGTLAHPVNRTTPDDVVPELVGSITIGTVTANSIQYSWPAGSDNTGVTSYEVSKDGGATWLDTQSTATTHTFSGLAPNTPYELRVRAKDAANNVSTPALAASRTTNVSGGATTVTMSGPNSGIVDVESAEYTVGANGTITAPTIVTLSDFGAGGFFTPATVTITAGAPTAKVRYTAAAAGSISIGATNNAGLANPAALPYTATVLAGVDLSTEAAALKLDNGFLLATTQVKLSFANAANDQHVVSKTLATNAQGRCGIVRDAALTAGQTYDVKFALLDGPHAGEKGLMTLVAA